jgi:hypothetical protein
MNKYKITKLESIEELEALQPGDIIKSFFMGTKEEGIWRKEKEIILEKIHYLYYEGHRTKELLRQTMFGKDIAISNIEKERIKEIRNGSIVQEIYFSQNIIGPKHYLYEPRQKMLKEKDLWRN